MLINKKEQQEPGDIIHQNILANAEFDIKVWNYPDM